MPARGKVSFSKLVKEVFREKLGDAEFSEAVWTGKSNIVWVRLPRGDDFYAYYVVQKRYDELTGELGCSSGTYDAGRLLPRFSFPLEPRQDVPGFSTPYGYRMRIGHVLRQGDVWWPCSENPDQWREAIEKLIEILIQYGEVFFTECRTQLLQDLRASNKVTGANADESK